MRQRVNGQATKGQLPLAGVRVVDLTRVMTGPYCTMMLADMGADVVKIEQPGRGDDTRHWGPPFLAGEAVYYLSINRNKRGIALDLKHPEGKDVLWRLIENADVLVENFSPGTIARLGFGYAEVVARRPEIVYCSISGFGQTGPGRERPGYDNIVQAVSGLMSITGPREGPPTKVGLPVADMTAGMFAAFAIVAALFRQARGGGGEYIDASLLAAQTTMMTYHAVGYLMTGAVAGMSGNAHPTICPYDTYPTADGYIAIAVGNDALWGRFCRVLGWEERITDPRYITNPDRVAHREELTALVTAAFVGRTSADILALMEAASVPAGPMNTLDAVFADAQVQHEQLARTVAHPTIGDLAVTGFPYHLASTDLDVYLPPPLLGEHTDIVLAELGYDAGAISALHASGAVA